jgi:hypothetical protein
VQLPKAQQPTSKPPNAVCEARRQSIADLEAASKSKSSGNGGSCANAGEDPMGAFTKVGR